VLPSDTVAQFNFVFVDVEKIYLNAHVAYLCLPGGDLSPPASRKWLLGLMPDRRVKLSREPAKSPTGSLITCAPALLRAGFVFGGDRVSVCLPKISKTTDQKLM